MSNQTDSESLKENTRDDYGEIAPWYDLEFDQFDDDIELYAGYASLIGSPVLELGCGTGRVLAALTHTGSTLYGLDTSASMLRRASTRLSNEITRQNLHLIQADMREFTIENEEPFRLIFSAINSFLHLPDRQAQLDCLMNVERHLDRDGLLILDVLHPVPGFLHDIDEHLHHDHTWEREHGQTVTRLSHRRLDVSEQRITTTLFYDITDTDGLLHRHRTSYWMRYIHRFEMEGLLSEAGFEIEGVYGSYQLDPLTDESSQMIFVAHRRARANEDPLL